MLKRKAFIFSLDAIFAIVIAAIMILACFFYLSKTTTNIYQEQDLYKILSDSLAVLEKDDTLKLAAETDSAATLQQFLNSLPYRYCGNITIYTSSQSAVLSAKKDGCAIKNETTVAYRNFILSNHTTHYARFEGWYK